MTPEEIRELPEKFLEMPAPLSARYADTPKLAALKLTLLVEIAAQLAEINGNLSRAAELFRRGRA